MNLSTIKIKLFNLSKIDFFLISYPKSGNTLVRFIFANILILSQKKNKIKRVDFSNIEEIVPTYISNEKIRYNYYKPLIMKAHNFTDKEILVYKHLLNKKIIYIYRNPVETLKSYYLYRIKVENAIYKNFSSFIRNEKVGIKAWIKHIEKYFILLDYIIKYEEIISNKNKEIIKIINYLTANYSIKIDNLNTIIQNVEEKTSREYMHRLEIDIKKSNNWDRERELLKGAKISDDYSFVNPNSSRNISVSNDDLNYIINEVKKIKNEGLKNIILESYFKD